MTHMRKMPMREYFLSSHRNFFYLFFLRLRNRKILLKFFIQTSSVLIHPQRESQARVYVVTIKYHRRRVNAKGLNPHFDKLIHIYYCHCHRSPEEKVTNRNSLHCDCKVREIAVKLETRFFRLLNKNETKNSSRTPYREVKQI